MPPTRTNAGERGIRNLRRALHLIEVYRRETDGRSGRSIDRELLRSSVVLAIGSLDAYLSDVSAEVLVATLARGERAGNHRRVLADTQKSMPHLALELAMAPSSADRKEMFEQAIVEHLQDHQSNHGAKAIDATLKRIGGSASRVWQAMADGSVDGVNTPGEARTLLEDFTDKRHRVIHRGKLPRVNEQAASRCGKLIQELMIAVDSEALRLMDG